jgi:hypothetical protein
MAAKTPTKLYSTGTYGRKAALYVVPNVTTNDTADIGSTGTNDFTAVYLAVEIADFNAALSSTSLTPATNLSLSVAAVAAQDVYLFVVGAGA